MPVRHVARKLVASGSTTAAMVIVNTCRPCRTTTPVRIEATAIQTSTSSGAQMRNTAPAVASPPVTARASPPPGGSGNSASSGSLGMRSWSSTGGYGRVALRDR